MASSPSSLELDEELLEEEELELLDEEDELELLEEEFDEELLELDDEGLEESETVEDESSEVLPADESELFGPKLISQLAKMNINDRTGMNLNFFPIVSTSVFASLSLETIAKVPV